MKTPIAVPGAHIQVSPAKERNMAETSRIALISLGHHNESFLSFFPLQFSLINIATYEGIEVHH